MQDRVSDSRLRLSEPLALALGPGVVRWSESRKKKRKWQRRVPKISNGRRTTDVRRRDDDGWRAINNQIESLVVSQQQRFWGCCPVWRIAPARSVIGCARRQKGSNRASNLERFASACCGGQKREPVDSRGLDRVGEVGQGRTRALLRTRRRSLRRERAACVIAGCVCWRCASCGWPMRSWCRACPSSR